MTQMWRRDKCRVVEQEFFVSFYRDRVVNKHSPINQDVCAYVSSVSARALVAKRQERAKHVRFSAQRKGKWKEGEPDFFISL